MKEITIKVPDNCELKQDGNTYTIVEKKVTYEDVARKLFLDKNVYYIDDEEIIRSYCCEYGYTNFNNFVSRKQVEKLIAINKLMNVAKYLNGDWQPGWNNYNECKYHIGYDNTYSRLRIDCNTTYQDKFIYFKSAEFAKQAIKILGEDTIKLALCTDY